MSKKKETYNRSRMMINEFIVNLCAKHYCSDGRIMPDCSEDKYGFMGSYLGGEENEPPIGALCRLIAAPSTKYYLSWYLGKKDGEFYMQSIEDHTVCRWSNVGVQYIPLKLTEGCPQFKYSDKQFKFHDRWEKIVREQNYWMVPMWSEFNDETGEVTITIRWKFKDTRIGRKFPSWETLTDEEMKVFTKEVETQGNK